MSNWKNVKWHWDHVEWGPFGPDKDSPEPYGYQFYIYWAPNWLPKEYRYWGIEKYWYDGPHISFGFWFFNISWSTPWSKVEGF